MSSSKPTSSSASSSTSAKLIPLSSNSTSAQADSLWFCNDFLLGAGMVIIQPSSGKVVLVYDNHYKYFFLPKGRKDVGESLEQAALREAHEESGYRAQFLPLSLPHLQPRPPLPPSIPGHPQNTLPKDPLRLSSEPIYISTQLDYNPRRKNAHEYITFWYVGYIEEDAVPEEGTKMADEQGYVTHLLPYHEAEERLTGLQGSVLRKAYEVWNTTKRFQEELQQEQEQEQA
ncbi:hypothetical protein M422DRAFT_190128 [Sphaerobolus stellatus SS14]|uniref:Nudix hydrolase domain-containing protein n=1 Tax=Sphaerobolus stellatus (strain SS14) TaxID=990650 RepID=A0A0C9TFM3_SPHS4|nr:hypothetical protein M422DRAFT_190128 [Sphaerobolus stellatus SS14]